MALLEFIQRRAPQGDLAATLHSMQLFAEEREWLKIAGGSKSKLLQQVLRPGDLIVEFGCFVGVVCQTNCN